MLRTGLATGQISQKTDYIFIIRPYGFPHPPHPTQEPSHTDRESLSTSFSLDTSHRLLRTKPRLHWAPQAKSQERPTTGQPAASTSPLPILDASPSAWLLLPWGELHMLFSLPGTLSPQFVSSVQSLSRVQLFATP